MFGEIMPLHLQQRKRKEFNNDYFGMDSDAFSMDIHYLLHSTVFPESA